ncbi:extracellular solute-binding protein (family 3) [Natranaerovirga hydrolytica]|uniref:Extracellular solute-binding protein (Family 3) n=1 Tax=Natranaerovirga hydrolytica TaxID=680378 RepID=A0A4R1N5F6_9FIRM|nr:transporter substrate-binding domain-containing protein [Natranaerovirga hydrolytica]TCK97843.1 extracellular solute-binding protein (family 3) [Natranaerovirga hydrolytica]
MNFKKIIVLIASVVLATIVLTGCSEEEGYVVGVTTGTTYGEVAEEYSNVRDVRFLDDDNYTLRELSQDRVDAVISDRLLALDAIEHGGFGDLRLAGDVLYTETMAVAISQDDNALRQAINEALYEIIEDGTYEEISNKYFGTNILADFDYVETFPDEEPATDDSLDRVLAAGEIQFAMSGGYRPFNYYDSNNELTGFDVEIGKEVANKLGVEYTPVTTDWSGIIEGLRSGRFDGIFGSMAITDDRLEVVDFTNPYYFSGAQIIVQEDSDITSESDLGERE